MIFIELNLISNKYFLERRRIRRPTGLSKLSTKSEPLRNVTRTSTREVIKKAQDRSDLVQASSANRFRVRTKNRVAAAGSSAVAVNSVATVEKKDKDGYKIVCYYTNWSQYRTKVGKFLPEDIPADLCTHVIFAFGWLKKGKLSSFESNDETKDGKPGLYVRINNLKKANPNLKVNFNSCNFENIKKSNFSIQGSLGHRRLVIRYPEIQGDVWHTLCSSNFHLLCHPILAGT